MSASQLNPRSIRRIGRATGLGEQIIRAWGHGGYIHGFVTNDHRHGWFNIKTHAWGFYGDDPMHYSSCDELFPG